MKPAVVDCQPESGVTVTGKQLKAGNRTVKTKEHNPHTVCCRSWFFLYFLCFKGYSDTVNVITYRSTSEFRYD